MTYVTNNIEILLNTMCTEMRPPKPISFFLLCRPSLVNWQIYCLQNHLHSSDIVLLGPHLDHGAQPRPHGLQVRRLPHLEQRLRDQRLASRQLLSVLKIFSTELKIFGTTQKIFVPVLANTASRGGSGSRRTRTRTSAACKCIWQMDNQWRRQISII